MKRLFIALLACTLILGYNDVQAQSKSKSKSKTSKSSSNKNKKGKKGKPEVETVQLTQLPFNSNDCLFAIDLNVDQTYGPTTAPQGAGRIMEAMADKRHPNLPEFEHNSVWYRFTVPYNGKLDIAITQQNLKDDYDMYVYRYTDNYFSNHIQCNKVLPVAVNMSSPLPDSLINSILKPKKAEPIPSTGDPKADLKAKNEAATARRLEKERNEAMGTIGMYHEATDILLTKASTNRHIRSIDVRKGEVYYILLDNVKPNGQGHSIKVSIHVDAFEVPVTFYDPKIKKNVDVNLTILEKNTDNRVIIRNDKFRGGRIKFVPGYNYTLYAKRDGYFSIFYDFNADRFKEDTLLRMRMNRAERGTIYPLTGLFFSDEYVLMRESDSTLMNYVQIFKNHPDVTFTVKGFVKTYNVDPEHDQLVSLERAKSVKKFFVDHGIPEANIKTSGMTPTDIKRAATAAFDTRKSLDEEFVSVQLIITSVGAKENP